MHYANIIERMTMDGRKIGQVLQVAENAFSFRKWGNEQNETVDSIAMNGHRIVRPLFIKALQ